MSMDEFQSHQFEETSHFQRGVTLYEIRRYDLAVRELEAALTEQPDHALGQAYLALCLLELKKHRSAAEMADRAVASNPDEAFAYYAQAVVARERKQAKLALIGIKRALTLDASHTGFLGLAALLAADRRDFKEALRLANAGLALDPGSSYCMNIRAMALIRMGETTPAREALLEELRRHPQDALTLANLGWLSLRSGQRQEALDLFGRSLAENPEDDYARSGLMEALRSRYPFYGLMLRYFTWMGDLSEQAQYLVLACNYALRQFLDGLERANPKLRPWIRNLRKGIGYFAYLTWVARPVSNLLLRCNSYARRLLNKDEYDESSLVGLSLAGALVCWALRNLTRRSFWGLANAVFVTMVIPIACTFRTDRGWRRAIMGSFTLAMFAVGMAGVYAYWNSALTGPARQLFGLYGLGLLVCQYLSSILNKIPDRSR